MSQKIRKLAEATNTTRYPAPVEGEEYSIPPGSSVGFEKLSLAVYGTRTLARAIELANPGTSDGPLRKIKSSVKSLKIPTREEATKLLEASTTARTFSPQPLPTMGPFTPLAKPMNKPDPMSDFIGDFISGPPARNMVAREPEKSSAIERSAEVQPRHRWNDHVSAAQRADDVYHAFDDLNKNARLVGAATGAALGFVGGVASAASAVGAVMGGTAGLGTVASLYYAPAIVTMATVGGGLLGGTLGFVAVETAARVAQVGAYLTFGMKNLIEDAAQAVDDLTHSATPQGG